MEPYTECALLVASDLLPLQEQLGFGPEWILQELRKDGRYIVMPDGSLLAETTAGARRLAPFLQAAARAAIRESADRGYQPLHYEHGYIHAHPELQGPLVYVKMWNLTLVPRGRPGRGDMPGVVYETLDASLYTHGSILRVRVKRFGRAAKEVDAAIRESIVEATTRQVEHSGTMTVGNPRQTSRDGIEIPIRFTDISYRSYVWLLWCLIGRSGLAIPEIIVGPGPVN
jgi:hypothetical protein